MYIRCRRAAGGVIGFELFYAQHARGAWLRTLPLLLLTGLLTLVWTAIIALSLQIVPVLVGLEQAYTLRLAQVQASMTMADLQWLNISDSRAGRIFCRLLTYF